jgi:Flp pilus assembly protein TadG
VLLRKAQALRWARRPWWAADGGGLAMPAALLVLPVIVIGFGAYDFARAGMLRSDLQDALDSAALFVGRSEEAHPAKVQEMGAAVLAENLAATGSRAVVDSVSFKIVGGTVRADARIAVDTVVVQFFVPDGLTVSVQSEVTRTKDPIELVLVLDNTWSMTEPTPSGGDKISALEKAAVGFVTTMQAVAVKAGGRDAVKIAVAPFSATVNVGPAYATSAWIDSAGVSPINDGLFYDGGHGSPHSWKEIDRPARLKLFEQMGIAWKGCVEGRVMPHDVHDTAPSGGSPETLFAPYFAPDEPDKDENAWNNYADDAINPSWDNSGTLFDRYWRQLQGNARKYTTTYLHTNRGARGPNNGCDTEPVSRLTNDLAKIKAAVADMPVGGATNIPMGLMWGWHLLSPNAPFADGSAYSKPGVKRVAVLVTDGENALEVLSSKNQSKYTGVGYVWQNRLGTTAADFNARKKAMDGRLATLCTNMKKKGIILFTVQVQVKGDSAALLRDCASRPEYFYDVQDAGKLEKTLQTVADEITRLRISR